ncbi:hypothetical protein VTK73DRAFT_7737 [Phialemonium thermophilum]|uniref:Uncharacterized protein n=1 Tax=Phialemonium thermophilum TaxID=223376 RepID=A0ABR3WD01_9PEZI
MLRLFRGMAALPVPSLETGGALWFPDLTVPDPLFILPVASSVLLYLVMKMNIPYMAEQQAKMMKLGAIIMGPLSLIVTIYFPAGLQFFFLVTGALQYLQTWLFYRPWLRRWANLPPLKPVAAAAAPDGPRVSPFSGGAAAATSATWQAPRTISTSARPVSSATDASEAAAASGASLLKQGSEVLSSVKSGLKAFQEKVGASAESKKRKKELEDAQKYEERRRLEEEQRYYARKAEWEMKRREKRP